MSLQNANKSFTQFFEEHGYSIFPHHDDHQGFSPYPIGFQFGRISEDEKEFVPFQIPTEMTFLTVDDFFKFIYKKMETESFFYLHEDNKTCIGVVDGNLMKGSLTSNSRKPENVRLRPTYSILHPSETKSFQTNEENIRK